MARPKRQYGTGCVIDVKGGLAIRWREREVAPDGSTPSCYLLFRAESLRPLEGVGLGRVLSHRGSGAHP